MDREAAALSLRIVAARAAKLALELERNDVKRGGALYRVEEIESALREAKTEVGRG